MKNRSHMPATAKICRAIALSTILLSTACGPAKPTADAEAQLMTQGLAQLYQSNQPVEAQATFRAVLQKNPAHYGAHYQLAVALDRGGKPVEGRAAWDDMRKLAEAISDTATLTTVKRRLASPDTASIDGLMALGLSNVWGKGDFPAAAEQFRAVLRRSPLHYGATYQLAATLDRMGKAAEARPLWVKVLGMATQYKDDKTIQIARDRLK